MSHGTEKHPSIHSLPATKSLWSPSRKNLKCTGSREGRCSTRTQLELEWRSAPVETFEFFAFSESRFVYFVRIHDAHAHLDDTKIEACAHTEYVLKSHKMVR